MSLSDICFVINKLDKFTNKDINTQSYQYIVSKQKKIIELLKKDVFKVITLKKALSNIF